MLLLLDARHGLKAADIAFFSSLVGEGDDRFKPDWSLQIVLTKCDLMNRHDLSRRLTVVKEELTEKLPGAVRSNLSIVLVSGKQRRGVLELQREVASIVPRKARAANAASSDEGPSRARLQEPRTSASQNPSNNGRLPPSDISSADSGAEWEAESDIALRPSAAPSLQTAVSSSPAPARGDEQHADTATASSTFADIPKREKSKVRKVDKVIPSMRGKGDSRAPRSNTETPARDEGARVTGKPRQTEDISSTRAVSRSQGTASDGESVAISEEPEAAAGVGDRLVSRGGRRGLAGNIRPKGSQESIMASAPAVDTRTTTSLEISDRLGAILEHYEHLFSQNKKMSADSGESGDYSTRSSARLDKGLADSAPLSRQDRAASKISEIHSSGVSIGDRQEGNKHAAEKTYQDGARSTSQTSAGKGQSARKVDPLKQKKRREKRIQYAMKYGKGSAVNF